MSTTNILEKAQKLLTLRDRAATEGESLAAARALAILLEKHRLTTAEVETASPDQREEIAIDEERPLFIIKRLAVWKHRLLNVLTRQYGCATFRRRGMLGNAQHLVGQPSDIAMVRYMWAWLTNEIECLVRVSPFRGRVARDSFREGFVMGIAEQFIAAKAEAVGSSSSEAGLVLASRFEDAIKHMHKGIKGLRTQPVYTTRRVHHGAMNAGKRRGLNHHLGGSLDGRVKGLLG